MTSIKQALKLNFKRVNCLALFCLFFIAFSFSSFALQSKKDSILLIGKIYNNDERVTGVIINVYEHNTLLKAEHVRSAHHFRMYIPKDKKLMIEITAENFHTKRFIFDSHLPEGLKRLPGYEFDMDIFSENELAAVNASLLDFPVGIVSYSEKKGVFVRDKAYTKKIKKEFFDLLEEAQMSDRGGIESE